MIQSRICRTWILGFLLFVGVASPLSARERYSFYVDMNETFLAKSGGRAWAVDGTPKFFEFLYYMGRVNIFSFRGQPHIEAIVEKIPIFQDKSLLDVVHESGGHCYGSDQLTYTVPPQKKGAIAGIKTVVSEDLVLFPHHTKLLRHLAEPGELPLLIDNSPVKAHPSEYGNYIWAKTAKGSDKQSDLRRVAWLIWDIEIKRRSGIDPELAVLSQWDIKPLQGTDWLALELRVQPYVESRVGWPQDHWTLHEKANRLTSLRCKGAMSDAGLVGAFSHD